VIFARTTTLIAISRTHDYAGIIQFGTIVMEAMTESSVDGTVDLDYSPSGVTWRLSCPAAKALEPGERSSSFEGTQKLY
jgi:hypothetical protein